MTRTPPEPGARRSGRRWALAAVAGLCLAWVVTPAAVPIYDGLSNPDEPYRYVAPPAGSARTPVPTNAVATVAVSRATNVTAYANTAENGPQLSLYLPSGALTAPAGATSITVTGLPLAASPPLPHDGTIVTNVYRIAATVGSRPVPVVGRGAQAPVLQMRAPSAQQPGPVFEHRTGSGWVQVKTLRVGNDVYQASAPAFGDWALVRLAHQPGTSGGGGGVNGGMLAAGIAVLVLAGAILAIRVSRTRRAAASGVSGTRS